MLEQRDLIKIQAMIDAAKPRPKIYLAGPIKGLSYGDATDWRGEAIRLLDQHGMDGFSPMRSKQFLKDDPAISAEFYDHVIATPQAIITRDHYDVRTSDMAIFNTLGASKVSLGTAMEIAWAYSYGVPGVLIIEPGADNPFHHEMVQAAVGYQVETLEQAVLICKAVMFMGDVEIA